MVVKQQNKRKLNTHLWFFGGFCVEINPKFVVLLDVGTGPCKNSLTLLWKAMNIDENVAGCCGEIVPEQVDYFNPIIMAQHVEYKFAHILDKALESVFGYITVLPGAFSAYRWSVIDGKPLWEDYFHSLKNPQEMDCFTSNVYLAEDRVLCLSIVATPEEKYKLRWIQESKAKTDVPEDFQKLLAQRRRWINGSWHALVSNLREFNDIKHTKHECCKKFALRFQFIYFLLNVVASWFMVGALFLLLELMLREVFMAVWDESQNDIWVNSQFLTTLYVCLLMLTFILSIGVQVSRVENIFKFLMNAYGLYMILMIIIMVFFMLDTMGTFNWLQNIAIVTIGIFAVTIIAHREVINILRGIL